MVNAGLACVVHHLRKTVVPIGESDRDLLARFDTRGDAAAFTELVARHGSMVLGVCRRVLRHEQDAEDAFQATFLVLARKARSLRLAGTAAPWLYEVATRTALRARSSIARRRMWEKQVDELPEPALAAAEPNDWVGILDEELNRLPEKYRAAVVLCELQGRSRKEAARLLGVPEGTLSSRLDRGRKKLAERLARRGLSGFALAGLAQSVPAPRGLLESTVQVAMLVAAGMEVAAAPAAILMNEVCKSMFLNKLKLVVSVVLVMIALCAGGVAYQVGRPAEARAETPAKPRTELERLQRENELLKLNLEVVLEKVKAQEAEIRALKGQAAADAKVRDRMRADAERQLYARNLALAETWLRHSRRTAPLHVEKKPADPVKQVEDALKALRAAPNKVAQRKAAEELDRATRRLQEHLKKGGSVHAPRQ